MKRIWLIILVFFIAMSLWSLPEEEKMIFVEQKEPFYITIEGAVTFPKTLVFYDDVSIYDIINYAGGYLAEADTSYVNSIYYNQTASIYVPYKTEEEKQETILININDASFQTLIQIPGMTETRAAELIVYRTQHGHFEHIDELLEVKYIGQATLESIRPYITTSST